MQFTTTMLGLVALGLNVLPALSVPTVAVPNADLSLRAEDATIHTRSAASDAYEKRGCAEISKRHQYCRDEDELEDPIAKRGCAEISKRHQYCRDADELDS